MWPRVRRNFHVLPGVVASQQPGASISAALRESQQFCAFLRRNVCHLDGALATPLHVAAPCFRRLCCCRLCSCTCVTRRGSETYQFLQVQPDEPASCEGFTPKTICTVCHTAHNPYTCQSIVHQSFGLNLVHVTHAGGPTEAEEGPGEEVPRTPFSESDLELRHACAPLTRAD